MAARAVKGMHQMMTTLISIDVAHQSVLQDHI